jgi:hypothetical protein
MLLQTDRLLLREFTEADWPAVLAYQSTLHTNAFIQIPGALRRTLVPSLIASSSGSTRSPDGGISGQ